MEEKPIECTGCNRKASIVYKKIKCGQIYSSKMCSSCPILESNIGRPCNDNSFTSREFDETKKCLACGATFEQIAREGKVSCSLCYQTFEEFLLYKLSESDAMPIKLDSDIVRKKTIPIHLGSSPNSLKGDEMRKKLESLKRALEESLSSENFERAALLRDEIKNLEKKMYGKQQKAS